MTRQPVRRQTLQLDDAAVDLIVERLAAKLRPSLLDKDPEFTRAEAADYCRLSTREFDRERLRHPDLLRAARETKPVLFRRSTLDVYRVSRPALRS